MILSTLASYAITWMADPTPAPTPPAFNGDADLVTPGVVGFTVTFLIAAITVFLIVDMTRRVRRVRYRGEVQEMLAAEEAEGAGGAGGKPQ